MAADPKEFRCDDLGSGVCGAAHSLICEAPESRLGGCMGRNRSLVRSKISEPIAPMAAEYLSRRSRDSLTMKSAKSLTRSASDLADASACAKAWNRSMLHWQNWSAVWLMTVCLFITVDLADTGVDMTLPIDPWISGRAACEELEADRLCGGGVGSALGAVACPFSLPLFVWYAFGECGENGGVDTSECKPADALGVEFLESMFSSPDSSRTFLPPLRGVPRCTENRRDTLDPCGTMISERGCAPALESSRLCRVRLSVRLSRNDFSPRTAPVLFNPPPAELDPDDESGWTEVPLLSTLDVSIVRPGGLGDLVVLWCSTLSFQLAGVGGTGPSAATPLGGGRLVGGDTIGSVVLLRLCDLD